MLKWLKPHKENSIFRNLHKNKRCFIIGNGSSLKKQNLLPLKNEITFVMNAFWKHPMISRDWQPAYYCFADPVTFDGTKPWLSFFSSVKKKINNSIFFVPVSGKEIIGKQNLLPPDKTYYVSFESIPEEIPEIDLTRAIPSVQSTSQMAMEIAIYMGCNPIYLLGMDHDWLAHRSTDRHFYEGKTVDDHPIAHNDLSKDSYKAEMESCLKLWEKYELLKKIATKKNIKIFNATVGGFLDVFEKKDYKVLFTT